MNFDLLSLQAVIIGVAIVLLVLARNSWNKRARSKREAEALTEKTDNLRR